MADSPAHTPTHNQMQNTFKKLEATMVLLLSIDDKANSNFDALHAKIVESGEGLAKVREGLAKVNGDIADVREGLSSIHDQFQEMHKKIDVLLLDRESIFY
jgi:hypothetical protein